MTLVKALRSARLNAIDYARRRVQNSQCNSVQGIATRSVDFGSRDLASILDGAQGSAGAAMTGAA